MNVAPMRAAARALALRAAAQWLAMGPPPRLAGPPQKILVIRPDHLGDVLFLTPALHALRLAQPQAEIVALVGPWGAGVLAGNPDVDGVETLPFPWFDRQPKAGALAPYRLLAERAASLRGRFDAAIVARFDHWWGAWLAAAARIPRRIGYDVPNVASFLTERVPYQPGQHEVRQNFGLAARLGVAAPGEPAAAPLRFVVSEADRAAAGRALDGTGLPRAQGPLVAIHPGSGAAVKRWEVAQWGRLMDTLRASHAARFVLTGGAGEVALAAQVAQAASAAPPVASVAGQTSLAQLAALWERCALVIGPDSGPLHLAVAMRRPTLHLYGPVSPQTFGPWGDPARHVAVTQSLACQFCHRLDWRDDELPDHPCVSAMPFAMVEEAAKRLLDVGG